MIVTCNYYIYYNKELVLILFSFDQKNIDLFIADGYTVVEVMPDGTAIRRVTQESTY